MLFHHTRCLPFKKLRVLCWKELDIVIFSYRSDVAGIHRVESILHTSLPIVGKISIILLEDVPE